MARHTHKTLGAAAALLTLGILLFASRSGIAYNHIPAVIAYDTADWDAKRALITRAVSGVSWVSIILGLYVAKSFLGAKRRSQSRTAPMGAGWGLELVAGIGVLLLSVVVLVEHRGMAWALLGARGGSFGLAGAQFEQTLGTMFIVLSLASLMYGLFVVRAAVRRRSLSAPANDEPRAV